MQQLPDSLHTLTFSDNDDDGYIQSRNGTIDLDISHMKELRILMLSSVINVTSCFPKSLRWLVG